MQNIILFIGTIDILFVGTIGFSVDAARSLKSKIRAIGVKPVSFCSSLSATP